MSKQLILSLTKQGIRILTNTFSHVPDDKINWKPLDNGRAALDLFSGAAQACGTIARFITSDGEEKPSREAFQRDREESAGWTREIALAAMETNSAALVAAIESLSEEQLATPVTLQFGGSDTTNPLGEWIMIAYRACLARYAQINYIQTLYGDFEAH